MRWRKIERCEVCAKNPGGRVAGVTERPDHRTMGDYFDGPRQAADGFFA